MRNASSLFYSRGVLHCDSAHLQIIYKSQVVEVYHSIFQLPLTFTVIDTSMPLSRQSLASPVTNLQVDM